MSCEQYFHIAEQVGGILALIWLGICIGWLARRLFERDQGSAT